MFKVMRSGKRQKKQWKRMVTKPTFVGAGFTRKPPKYERFIRPTGTNSRPQIHGQYTSIQERDNTCQIPAAAYTSSGISIPEALHMYFSSWMERS